jgi:integral membrane sensor domain MASE1
MAVVNIHGQPALEQRELTLLSDRFFGSPRLTSLKFWLTGIAFLTLYLAFNKLTEWYQFDGLGITLWSPDDGLCLLLLTEGAMFAPFVFLGAVLTDIFITGVPHSLYVTVVAELVLTVGYLGLAAVLRHKLKFDPRRVRLTDVVVLLTFVPAGTTLTALSYCWALYLGGALPADQFSAAMRYLWIGDTVGIITIIPAATSVFVLLSKARWHWSGDALVSCFVFILGTCLGFLVLFSVGATKEYHLFYLLFLPIIWVGIRRARGKGIQRLPNAHAGAFDHRVAARRRHHGTRASGPATAGAADGIGARVSPRHCGRDGHGARS